MPGQDPSGTVLLQLLVYGLANGAVLALNAVGFTLSYAVARQLNLAHGSVFTLTTVVVANLAGWLGVTATAPLAVRIGAFVLLLAVGAACGAVLNTAVERVAFRPFRAAGDTLAPLIATVAVSFLLLGLAVRWPKPPIDFWTSYHHSVFVPLLAMPDLLPAVELGWGGVSLTLKDLLVVALAAGTVAAVRALLLRTRLGRLLRATTEHPELAALCGADPQRAQTAAFALGGALAGLGAATFAAYYGGASVQWGVRSGLTAMTAAVLGGVGDPVGALLGGVLLGVASSFSDYWLDAHWTPVLVLTLLVVLLAVRPTGLLGQTTLPSGNAEPAPPSLAVEHRPAPRWLLWLLVAFGLCYPLLDQLFGWNRLYSATPTLLLVTLAIGLGIVVGFAGLLDLGYAAFFAIGGYTAALLTASGSAFAALAPPLLREPWAALALAGLAAAGFGLLFGLPSVRTRGEYLAIVTLAFGEIVPSVIWHLPEWTGGPRGVSGVPPLRFGPGELATPLAAYLLALGLALLAGLVAARLAWSRPGRAWAAVRDDEVAATSVGVDPPRAKLLAFALGAAYAGVAGALSAGLVGYIMPQQFDFTLSMLILTGVVLGGRWGTAGVALGALTVAASDRLLVDGLNLGLQALGRAAGWPALQSADLRGDNFLLVGAALYLATLTRRWQPPARPSAAVRPTAGLAPAEPA